MRSERALKRQLFGCHVDEWRLGEAVKMSGCCHKVAIIWLVVRAVGGRDVELRVRASVGSVFMLYTVGTNLGTERRSA